MFGKYFVVVCIFVSFVFVKSDQCSSLEEGRRFPGKILFIAAGPGSDEIYVATDRGLFVCDHEGVQRDEVELPANVLKPGSVAVTRERVFIVSDGELYGRLHGKYWEKTIVKGHIEGVNPFRGDNEKRTLAWTEQELYILNGSEKIHVPVPDNLRIWGAEYINGYIAVLTDKDLYIKKNDRSEWKKIILTGGMRQEEEVFYGEDEETISGVRGMTVLGAGKLGVIVNRGIIVFDPEKEEQEYISTRGLPSSDVRRVEGANGVIFAATSNRVFSWDGRVWERIFLRNAYAGGDINFGKARNKTGREMLFVSAGNTLYGIDAPEKLSDNVAGPEVFNRGKVPSVLEVQKMAIDYAEVSPDKIRRWRQRVEWKAVLPKLGFKYSNTRNNNVETYKSATTSYIVTGPEKTRSNWDVSLSWDLAEIVWNSSHTSIDVRSKLMVQLREDLLEEVTRLYFERERLLLRSRQAGAGEDSEARMEDLKLLEVTAYIDALTGGQFSRSME